MKISVYLSLATLSTLFTVAIGRLKWTAAQANDWWAQSGWFAGCNFIPSTAVNVLEMWQAETFDPVTIDRELGYA